MKIIKESTIKEKFPNEETLRDHYERHVKEQGFSINKFGEKEPEFTPDKFPDIQSYDNAADKFARKPVKDSEQGRIVGFVDKKNKHHKYDKKTGEFTAYYLKNGEPVNMSYYLFKNKNRYERDKKKYYDREINDEHFK